MNKIEQLEQQFLAMHDKLERRSIGIRREREIGMNEPKEETLAELNKRVTRILVGKINKYIEEQTKKQQEEKEKQ